MILQLHLIPAEFAFLAGKGVGFHATVDQVGSFRRYQKCPVQRVHSIWAG